MIDPNQPDFFTDGRLLADPYPYLDTLREQGPVIREPHRGVYMVTGYDEALQVYNDTDSFSACLSVSGPFPGFPVPLDGRSKAEIDTLIAEHRGSLPMSDQLPTLDPPIHTDHRSLLARLITPKRLKENEAFISRLADDTLDGFLATGGGDYVERIAGPLAMLVVADLLGVPEIDHEAFRAALLDSHAGEPGRTRTLGSTTGEALTLNPLEFLYGQFTTYITERRAAPRDDVLTGLATATFPDGSEPDVLDAVCVAANLFAAGQETTVRLLSSGVLRLADDPGLQSRLRSDPDLVPEFVEEVLRTESPIKGNFRLARCPVDIGGTEVPAGAIVMLLNAAANRDPRRFDDPHAFELTRANARIHLAFGRGIHTCPGAPLARAEGRIGIQRLLERTRHVRISEEHHGPPGARRFRYAPTFILRGVTRLHVEVDPA